MQIRRLGLFFAAMLAAVSWAVACGGPGAGPAAGSTCASDTECIGGDANMICHPTAKICVQSCNAAADCPSTAKNCAALPSAAGADAGTADAGTADGGTTSGAKFCQCSTTELCGGGTGSSVICAEEDKICTTKCSDDTACTLGRKCDTATGQCKTPAPTTCTPACTGNQVCDTSVSPPACVNPCKQGTCTGGNICNFSTGLCEAPKTCTSANPQPDACSYGQFCPASACAEVAPASTCGNFFTPSKHGLEWGFGKNGPVIWSVVAQATVANSPFCSGVGATNFRYRVTVRAYSPTGAFPTSDGQDNTADERTMETLIHLVDPTGDEISDANTIQNVTVTNGNRNAEFTVNFCRQVGGTYSAGMHFTNGNEVCLAVPQ